MKNSSRLKRKLTAALLAFVITIAAVTASSFAWYIYNTNAHTTKLHMAAGSSSSLLISDSLNGEYKYSIALDSVVGELLPVSTNSILGGFQEMEAMKEGGQGQPAIVAYLFRGAKQTDYFVRSLYLRSDGGSMNVYVKNIGFKDSSTVDPISTAIRVGLVTYQPGNPQAVDKEYIFEINPDQHVSKPQYNTATGKDGYVLDADAYAEGEKQYGVTVPFSAFKPENYCEVTSSGEVRLRPGSVKITQCPGMEGQTGSPVRVDIYIWLEGCDSDCYGTLGTLSDLSIEFAGFDE